MGRPRFSIARLMAVVVAIAINLAVIRAFVTQQSGSDPLPNLFLSPA